jgi:hypothetical protein
MDRTHNTAQKKITSGKWVSGYTEAGNDLHIARTHAMNSQKWQYGTTRSAVTRGGEYSPTAHNPAPVVRLNAKPLLDRLAGSQSLKLVLGETTLKCCHRIRAALNRRTRQPEDPPVHILPIDFTRYHRIFRVPAHSGSIRHSTSSPSAKRSYQRNRPSPSTYTPQLSATQSAVIITGMRLGIPRGNSIRIDPCCPRLIISPHTLSPAVLERKHFFRGGHAFFPCKPQNPPLYLSASSRTLPAKRGVTKAVTMLRRRYACCYKNVTHLNPIPTTLKVHFSIFRVEIHSHVCARSRPPRTTLSPTYPFSHVRMLHTDISSIYYICY